MIQVVIIEGAAVEMDLAAQLWSKRGPIALHDIAKVVVLAPVRGDCRFDFATHLVEDPFGVSSWPFTSFTGGSAVPTLPDRTAAPVPTAAARPNRMRTRCQVRTVRAAPRCAGPSPLLNQS